MLYDAHAHLDMMEEGELCGTLKKAAAAGVGRIISCSTSFASNEKNLSLAQKFPQISAAIGLYPLNATELTKAEIEKAFEYFKLEIKRKEAIAIGEVGLDFKYCKKEEEQKKQAEIFARFIELSNKTKKPLIIHSRFAQRQVLEELENHGAKKALLHSFVDSQKLMKRAAKTGHFVSAGLSILHNEETQKNISVFPIEKLLFETDSPIHFNGENASPQKIAEIAKKTAELKGTTIEEIEEQQEKNFKKLFS